MAVAKAELLGLIEDINLNLAKVELLEFYCKSVFISIEIIMMLKGFLSFIR